MKSQALNTVASAGAILVLGATASLAGVHDIVAPPPPAKECDGCNDPGFFVQGTLLYLKSYNSDIGDYSGEWDLGYRGKIGYENASGLRFELTGFYHQTDFTGEQGLVTGTHTFYSVDATLGDTIHCGELCLSIAAGLRFGGNEFDEDWGRMATNSEFNGIGPVIAIEATRSLSERFALYATLRQALLFGEEDYFDGADTFTTDTLASVTEIGAGFQMNFGVGGVTDAYVRAGFEGQYWLDDGGNIGLFGGVLGLGANF
jgi:hypothetical protein